MSNRSYLLILAWLPLSALANTSSVFSPDVDSDDFEVEYRASYEPEDSPAPSAFSHRIHVQRAFDDTWRVRLIGSQSRSGSSSLSYNYTRLELMQQVLEDENAGWDAAIRYELQISDRGGRPDRFRIAGSTKWDVDDNWQLRTNVLLGRQFGDNAASGVFVETRGQITRRFAGGRLGLEMYNDLNRTSDFGSFDDQEHQLGPIAKYKWGDLSINASYLFGLSGGAADDNLRLHLIYPL